VQAQGTGRTGSRAKEARMSEGKIEKMGNVTRVAQFVKLPRSGDIPIGFYGERVAARSGETLWGREHSYWYEISIYKSIANKFIIAVRYRSAKEKDEDHDDVLLADDVTDVVMQLREYERERALLTTFRHLIAAVADDLGVVEMVDLPSEPPK